MVINFSEEDILEKLQEMYETELNVSIQTANQENQGWLTLVGKINKDQSKLDIEIKHTPYMYRTEQDEMVLDYLRVRHISDWNMDNDFYALQVLASKYEMSIDEYENAIESDEDMEEEYQQYEIDMVEDTQYHSFMWAELGSQFYFQEEAEHKIDEIIKEINNMDSEQYTFIDQEKLIKKLTQ